MIKLLRWIALTLALFMTLAAATNWLSQRPILLRSHEAEIQGAPMLRRSNAQVALVVDTTVIRRAGLSGRFSQVDWSYGWTNTLLQECPRYDILDASLIAESVTVTDQYRTLIFSHSATTGMAKGRDHNPGNSYWRHLGDSGRTIVLEMPPASSAALQELRDTKVSLAEVETTFTARHLSVIGGPPLRHTFPLNAVGASLRFTPGESQVHLELDGAPVMVETQLGAARVLVLAIDMGQLVVTIQQGRPNDDFSITPRVRKRDGLYPVVTSDLCADSSYYDAWEPFLDTFERALFAIIDSAAQPATLFSESRKGAFIMSHDEEGIGDKSVWMAAQEKKWGLTSSYFVIPAQMTTQGLKSLQEAGAEIGIHVDKYTTFDRPGLPGLRPFLKEIPIPEQIRRLELLADPGISVMVNRNHWLLWDGDYSQNFRRMAAAGLAMDLSYGPLGVDVAGYLFGTAFPFLAMDNNGFPLPILELPFLFQDDEKFAAAFLDRVFDTSAFDQEVINYVFHVNTMGHRPDTVIMSAWKESFHCASEAGLKVASYGQILESIVSMGAPLPASLMHSEKK